MHRVAFACFLLLRGLNLKNFLNFFVDRVFNHFRNGLLWQRRNTWLYWIHFFIRLCLIICLLFFVTPSWPVNIDVHLNAFIRVEPAKRNTDHFFLRNLFRVIQLVIKRAQLVKACPERDLQLFVFIQRDVLNRPSEVQVSKVLPVPFNDEVVARFRVLFVTNIMDVSFDCVWLLSGRVAALGGYVEMVRRIFF